MKIVDRKSIFKSPQGDVTEPEKMVIEAQTDESGII